MSKKQLKIEVPNNWKHVTLNEFLKLQRDMDAYGDTEEGLTAALFYNLCNIDPYTMKKLDMETYGRIKQDLFDLLNSKDLPLQRIIEINGKRYGFEPDLSKMAYGAYLDIQKYKDLSISKEWAEIMSILYRPIVKERGTLYEIEPYNGKIDGELFMNVDMHIHFGALFFFLNLLVVLSQDTLKSLMKKEEMTGEVRTILERSGVLTPQYIN